MPRLEPEMKTGKIVEWVKKEGDRVLKEEPIARIDVEKVAVEITSPASGTLSSIIVQTGMEAEVGAPIALIDVGDRSKIQSQEEHTVESKAHHGGLELSRRKLEGMRKAIADKMMKSWTEIPQVPLMVDVDLTYAERFRSGLEKESGKRISFTAFVVRAVATALLSFEELNSRFEEGEIVQYREVDVSVAVALDDGLITPVVRRAESKTVQEISDEIEDLADRARKGELVLSEVMGGTITISNLASYGVDSFIPIINPPQVCILGVGRGRTSADGSRYCTMTLVFDHRVTDGARASQFLNKIKECMEKRGMEQDSVIP